MAYDFYEKTNLPAPIVDVYLMGSSANYNWTPDSDVDVHIIIDYRRLQMPQETANKTVKTAGAQWNAEHNVLIKGHKVEMNLQNAAEQKPYVTGIYSLVKDQWIRRPVKLPIQINKGVLKFQYDAMKKYLLNALSTCDREQMKAAKKYLDAFRQYGLDTYGELSYENLIFKMLRARGLIKQLKNSITGVYDQQMSVAEVGEKDIKQTLPNLSKADHPDVGDARFDRSHWDKYDREKNDYRLDRITLDELKALRAKELRMYSAYVGREDVKLAALHKAEFEKYDAEIHRRMTYINAPVQEGFGAGIPEDDRLKIKNDNGSTRRWQIRSKDAPKTPKMTKEEVIAIPQFDNPVKSKKITDDHDTVVQGLTKPDNIDEDIHHGQKLPQPEHPLQQLFKLMQQQGRINLFPTSQIDAAPPYIRKIIKIAERILDKKAVKQKFFPVEEVEELLDDLIRYEIAGITDGPRVLLRVSMVKYLSNDYDIRYEGERIVPD